MFFKKLGEYIVQHGFLFGMLIFGFIALAGVIVAMVLIRKKRITQDAVNKRIAAAKKKAEAETRKEEAREEEENKANARQAVFDKLDAQREEADKESAQQDKEEQKPKKAPAKKKPAPAKEELAVAEEPKKEESKKATAKKAEPKKEEPKKEEPAKEVKVEKKTTAKKAEPKKEEPAKEVKAEKKATAKTAEPKKQKTVEEKVVAPASSGDENDTSVIARYAGKWVVYHLLTDENNPEDEMYFFELHASNGEKLLTSEEYTSYNGAIKGIETYKANIAKDNFKITVSKKGDYIFKLMSGKNTLLCNGENYSSRVNCESAIKSTKRFAKTAIIDEDVRDQIIKVPVETETEIEPLPEGLTGKWLISSREVEEEKVYYFELFANNGEKLLSSEEYTTYSGAVNGIQTHKQNIAKGNFRISLTKNGDYIYKLLNGNNQLLCLGEHYKSKTRCQSAVESVKRFSANSPTLTESDEVQE